MVVDKCCLQNVAQLVDGYTISIIISKSILFFQHQDDNITLSQINTIPTGQFTEPRLHFVFHSYSPLNTGSLLCICFYFALFEYKMTKNVAIKIVCFISTSRYLLEQLAR